MPRLIEKLVLQRHTLPCVVVGPALEIVYLFGPTDPYLARPQGEARMDLLSWMRPELYARLRAGLAEAFERHRPVTLRGLRLEGHGEVRRVEIAIEPLAPGLRPGGLVLVAFRDLGETSTTPLAAGDAEGDDGAVARQIRQELDDTREQLRTAVDQLRTANEEHRASYEELLSLNEELQSSNEELETSKEELQSPQRGADDRQPRARGAQREAQRSVNADLENLLALTDDPHGVPRSRASGPALHPSRRPASWAWSAPSPTSAGRSPTFKLRSRTTACSPTRQGARADLAPLELGGAGRRRALVRPRILPYRDRSTGRRRRLHDVQRDHGAKARGGGERGRPCYYAEAIVRDRRALPLLVLDHELSRRLGERELLRDASPVLDPSTPSAGKSTRSETVEWDIPRAAASSWRKCCARSEGGATTTRWSTSSRGLGLAAA
jgi:hypothetical protein